ncbi:MAG: ribosome maturation factor RimP, partial [Synergistales bacterium]|nr:ribosome maturation factor RimP [Synergistales bacterium]
MSKPAERDALRRMHGSIRELVEASGYEYVWSELVMEEGRSVLRVLMDSLGGVNVKDCETVSRKLGRMLDD